MLCLIFMKYDACSSTKPYPHNNLKIRPATWILITDTIKIRYKAKLDRINYV